MNFEQFNLDSRLMAGIKRAGYETPTPIQEVAIPAALAGDDLIGTAQTGTGKTAAFVLPILHKLLNGPRRVARALIVTPTRELAEQINDSIRELAVGTQIRSATIYGGVGPGPQVKALRDGVEILVACPGRLLDLIAQGYARLGGIEVLVLDEADRMFDMGFLPDVRKIIKAVPPKRQTMLFSATFPKEIEELASMSLHEPHRTDTDSVLVFTRTKHRAERLAHQIAHAGFRVTSLHSNRSQNQRQAALNGFKSGHFQFMVAADIAARGLDVESISHVINFDMPDTADAYIHRIGRTGRAERTGDAFTLVTPDDNDMIRTLEKIMGKPLPRQSLPDFDYTAPAPPKAATVIHPTHHSPTPHHAPAVGQRHATSGQPSRPRQKPR
ncbi:MAG: DEAD/DEAH box helicase [Chloroflexi bacterium]|nr:DEAD/DEAH box helicase [Chloroflexota bacterium]